MVLVAQRAPGTAEAAKPPGLPPELWAVVFANTHEAILITGADGTIVDVNPGFTRITGFERDEAIGRSPRLLKSGYQDAKFYEGMWRALRVEGRWQGEIWNRRKNGGIYPEFLTISAVHDAAGALSHYIAIFYDISFVKEQTERFRHLAHHDVLTGLPNRLALNLMLPQAIAQARRQGTRLAVCLIDLDDFKPVNDTHGHKAGDDLLRVFARDLKSCVRASDMVARLGGDEFVVLLGDVAGDDEAEACLQRIGRLCGQAFALPGVGDVRIGLSMGWTCYPEDDPNGTDAPELLLRNADMALYVAKAQKGDHAAHRHRWGQSTGAEVIASAASPVAAYGDSCRRLLRLGAGGLSDEGESFVDAFYESLFADAQSRRILAALDDAELDELKRRQQAHLRGLLAPDLEESAHARRARHVGTVHGVLGLSPGALVEAMGVYQHSLVERVVALPLRVADRAALVQVLNLRLKNELRVQLDAIDEVRQAWTRWLAALSASVLDAVDAPAFLDRCVDSICALPGVAGAAWSRVDAERGLVIMHSAGVFDAYRNGLAEAGLTRDDVLDSAGGGAATVARAWQAGDLVINPTYVRADYPPAWREVAHRAGIRSSAAFAVTPEPARGVLLSVYSRYPAQFDAEFMRFVLGELRRMLTRVARVV